MTSVDSRHIRTGMYGDGSKLIDERNVLVRRKAGASTLVDDGDRIISGDPPVTYFMSSERSFSSGTGTRGSAGGGGVLKPQGDRTAV